MLNSISAISDPILPMHHRPEVTSFDSAEECSLDHWLLVCRLVDEGDTESDIVENSVELEQALEETLLEVESATAYQHFAGDVV